MKLVKAVTWLGAATVVLLGLGWIALRTSATNSQAGSPLVSSQSEEAVALSSTPPALNPNTERPPQPSSSLVSHSAESWQIERAKFLQGDGYAASIQRALAEPTAARLFYASRAVDLCTSMSAMIGQSATSAPRSAGFERLGETCKDVLAMNGNQVEFFAKVRSAKLAPTELAVLDAVDGRGNAKDAPFAQRFATVSASDDALLIGDVGAAWLRSSNASFAGVPLTDGSRAVFQEAWVLATCEETASCDSSLSAFRLCSLQQQCNGSLRMRLESVLTKEEYEALITATNAVSSALKTKDFSAFN